MDTVNLLQCLVFILKIEIKPEACIAANFVKGATFQCCFEVRFFVLVGKKFNPPQWKAFLNTCLKNKR